MLAVALEATLEAAGPQGAREIRAEDFLLGYFTTALEPGEIVTGVRFPAPCRRAAIEEFARRRGDFALVAVVVALPDGGRPRIVVGGVDAVPVRARQAEGVLADAGLSPAAFDEAAQTAAAEIDPTSDVHASARYRRELAAVLVEQAIASAVNGGR
jgi:carbon-monoxide dehydrogenase medium subunit